VIYKEEEYMNITRRVTEKLLKSGWTSQRKINIEEILGILSSEGYKAGKHTLSILENFGNLEFEHPAFRVENELQKLHFNPIQACENIYRENVEDYEKRVGESLVVIGEAYDGYMTMMVSETGKIYGGYDDDLSFFGNSLAEALEVIYFTKEIKKIK